MRRGWPGRARSTARRWSGSRGRCGRTCACSPGWRGPTGGRSSGRERWPPFSTRRRRLAGVTVVDCSFSLEDDEELSFDTAAPRRNGATLAVLEAADTVLCVSGADPVALQRSIRALGELREVLPDVEPVLVVNQVRRGPVPGDPRQEIATALGRFTGRDVRFFLPADRRATDAALAAGRTLAEVAATSPLRVALRSLAAEVAEVTEPATGRRARRRDRAAG